MGARHDYRPLFKALKSANKELARKDRDAPVFDWYQDAKQHWVITFDGGRVTSLPGTPGDEWGIKIAIQYLRKTGAFHWQGR